MYVRVRTYTVVYTYVCIHIISINIRASPSFSTPRLPGSDNLFRIKSVAVVLIMWCGNQDSNHVKDQNLER